MSPSDAATAAPSTPSSEIAPLALRDPLTAGLLAWLIPGAGHWYQRRRAKAVLYFLCIFGTFLYGLRLGEGRVVYASWGPTTEEKRLPYLCQIGAGVITLPALYQAHRFSDERTVREIRNRAARNEATFWDAFMAPPRLEGGSPDELDRLNYRLNRRFELGTVYTMVAGLLNLLAVFDAVAGPAYGSTAKKK